MKKFKLQNLLLTQKGFMEIYENYILLAFLSGFSFFSFFLSLSYGKLTAYADTQSRLDLARKVIDNLHPGFAQFGNVWLPLPQMLMVPFIWNDFLWHSGVAGSLMSMPAFIIGGFYIFKTAKLLTKSSLASFLGTSIYALNINMLYLQTTAMSESLFLCLLAAAIYYFVRWTSVKETNFYIIPAALAVSAMTYTRYEGLSMLLASIPMVFVMSLIMKRKYAIAESETILYSTLAITGFLAWSIYLWAIFGDPLYWVHFYAGAKVVTTSANHTVQIYSQHKSFLAAGWEYFTAFSWMAGLIPTIFCGLGLIVMLVKSVINKTLYFIPLLLPLSIFLFMALTLQRNTSIVQPDLTFQNILSPKTSYMTGFNIRYGILLLPWVAVICSYVFSFRYKIINLIVFSVFFIQIFTYLFPNYTAIYQITYQKYTTKYYPFLVQWMKTHYTGGEILMSSYSHEDQMFQMGFNYRTFIHEGAGKYWKESIDNPSRYAMYVIIDAGHPDDKLQPYFVKNPHRQGILDRDYDLAFDDRFENVKIYKKKTKPYFQI